MADNRPLIEKMLNMLADDNDAVVLVAARKIAGMAKKEKKLVADICMGGKTVYVDKVVYRDAAPQRGPTRDDIWEAMRKAQEQSQQARQQQRQDQQKAREDAAKARYNGAFDDAEMSDAEREEYRAKRASAKARAKARRVLLDELSWAYENHEDDLTHWEVEFASTIPFQYEADYDLSRKQVDTARRIIAKVRRNRGESPI
jgi:hypothetical protein